VGEGLGRWVPGGGGAAAPGGGGGGGGAGDGACEVEARERRRRCSPPPPRRRKRCLESDAAISEVRDREGQGFGIWTSGQGSIQRGQHQQASTHRPTGQVCIFLGWNSKM
jgi:hypothetical protein